jgi:hypothetical protein
MPGQALEQDIHAQDLLIDAHEHGGMHIPLLIVYRNVFTIGALYRIANGD